MGIGLKAGGHLLYSRVHWFLPRDRGNRNHPPENMAAQPAAVEAEYSTVR